MNVGRSQSDNPDSSKKKSWLLDSPLLCVSIFSFSLSSIKQWLSGKEPACNAGDPGSIPGSGYPLEKEMATHSSILAGESHGGRSLGSYSSWGSKRVRYNWVTQQL